MTIEALKLELLLTIAIPAVAFILFFAGYFVGKWRQKRFNKKRGLPQQANADAGSDEIEDGLAKTAVQTHLGGICQHH